MVNLPLEALNCKEGGKKFGMIGVKTIITTWYTINQDRQDEIFFTPALTWHHNCYRKAWSLNLCRTHPTPGSRVPLSHWLYTAWSSSLGYFWGGGKIRKKEEMWHGPSPSSATALGFRGFAVCPCRSLTSVSTVGWEGDRCTTGSPAGSPVAQGGEYCWPAIEPQPLPEDLNILPYAD